MLALLSACDTGDGKQLPPINPDVTTIATVPPATDSASLPAGEQLDADDLGEAGATTSQLAVFAPWVGGGPIDPRHTCDGDDVSPALSWANVPAGTAQIAFALVDDSAVGSDGTPFVHWVLAGVEATEVGLAEATVPPGAAQGVNSFGDTGWSGPCPPPGDAPHDYRLTMYALNQQVELADGTPAKDLLDFVESVSIASTDLIGTYQR